MICAYLKILDFTDSIILSACEVSQLMLSSKCHQLNYANLDDLNFIAGPYNINNNHWLAVIIDINKEEFILLDPLVKSTPLADGCFESWCTYYNNRKHKREIKWSLKHVDHPIQTDHFNCGVFVIRFIEKYLKNQVDNNQIHFDTSVVNLECDRLLISSAIESFKK